MNFNSINYSKNIYIICIYFIYMIDQNCKYHPSGLKLNTNTLETFADCWVSGCMNAHKSLACGHRPRGWALGGDDSSGQRCSEGSLQPCVTDGDTMHPPSAEPVDADLQAGI